MHQFTFIIKQTLNLRPLPFVEEATGIDQEVTDIRLLSTALLDCQIPFSTTLVPIAGQDARVKLNFVVQPPLLSRPLDVSLDLRGRSIELGPVGVGLKWERLRVSRNVAAT